MIVEEILINNFATIGTIYLDMDQPIISLMLGDNKDTGKSNESGKSSIFNALCWCFFGKYPAGGGRMGDEVVNPKYGKDCYVSIRLRDTNQKSVIQRYRKHSIHGNQVIITMYDNTGLESVYSFDLGLKSNNAHTQAIQEILGMDYENFVRSYYLPQEGVEPFGRMTDKELKTFMLEKLLNLNWLPDAHINAKESLGYLETHLIDAVATINRYEEKITEAKERIEKYIQKDTEWKEQQSKNNLGLKEEIADLEGQIRVIEENSESIAEKINEIKLAINMGTDNVDWNVMLAKANKKYSEWCDLFGRLSPRIETLQENYEIYSMNLENIETMSGKTCETCGNIIKPENIPYMQKDLLKKLKNINKEKDKIEPEFREASQERDALAAEIKGIEKRIEEQKEKLENIQELQGKLFAIQQMTDVTLIQSQIKTKQDILDNSESLISPYKDLIEQEEGNIDLHKTHIAEDIIRRKGIEDRIKRVQFWENAFSSKGIQSFILDSITNTLNSFIAEYLQDLADGRISARLTTVKKLKSGEFREKFGVEINNMDGGKSYASLSGGAKKRVDLAISLAISRFKRAISEKELKLLVYDEITNGMDSYWIERTLNMILDKFKDYAVFFITHQDINPVYFDRVITVVKENGTTMLEE